MKVLIVDDHATSRKLLQVSLESEGHKVLEAADGVEALGLLSSKPVDAVISDILMPNMDGFHLCLEIRKDDRLRELPFIIYTSTYDSPTDRQLAKSVGADNYVVKPAPIETIVKVLAKTAANGHTRQAPVPTMDSTNVLKQYNEGLVAKLEEKNHELQETLIRLRHAHEQIMELNRDLEQRVQNRTLELSKANQELNRQNTEIQSFYHTLSHELKTPLTSAREFASLVMDELGGPITEIQREYLGLALESCDQMRRCLDDLFDASRLDTGKLSLEVKTTSLLRVTHQVVKSFKPLVAGKKIRLESHLAKGLPIIQFDEHRIVQVLNNLINNAVKFTPEGGTVSVTLGPALQRPGFQQISVRDTGSGIPRDQMGLIFNRLYQIRQDDGVYSQGMGLGLYLCRELVLLHGGQIWVESEPGRGSTFSFDLPGKTAVKKKPAVLEPAFLNHKNYEKVEAL